MVQACTHMWACYMRQPHLGVSDECVNSESFVCSSNFLYSCAESCHSFKRLYIRSVKRAESTFSATLMAGLPIQPFGLFQDLLPRSMIVIPQAKPSVTTLTAPSFHVKHSGAITAANAVGSCRNIASMLYASLQHDSSVKYQTSTERRVSVPSVQQARMQASKPNSQPASDVMHCKACAASERASKQARKQASTPASTQASKHASKQAGRQAGRQAGKRHYALQNACSKQESRPDRLTTCPGAVCSYAQQLMHGLACSAADLA